MFEFTEEQRMIRETVRKLGVEKLGPRASEVDKSGEFPWDIVKILGENGILQLPLPEKYGGIGADTTTSCMVSEELARFCTTSSNLLCIQASNIKVISLGGNESQRDRFFQRLGKENQITAFALTEPGAGSDVGAMKTRAVRCGDFYILNGTKCFISGGAVADILPLFAMTDPAKGLKGGVSAFVLEKGAPGFKIGKTEEKMGSRGVPASELVLEDAQIPIENLLGKEGEGLKIALGAINLTRLTVGSHGLGIAQGALDYAIEYAKQRVQFGKPIAAFQGIQFKIADMAMQLEAARSLLYRVAFMSDQGVPDIEGLSSMAKCLASEVSVNVCLDAVKILGGYGYMKDYPQERRMRDAMSCLFMEGTGEIQRQNIARFLLKKS
ncbi:MAG: acyl-CoA dehydrogenase [Syntrophobacterales bacterium CG_4_8_14_3_um_filter_49_14]|nr:MAG: acyl-CoA dehydrogenase [Syntrophobacterales bacterium CG_4_8_14_3_um_filter_49_14]